MSNGYINVGSGWHIPFMIYSWNIHSIGRVVFIISLCLAFTRIYIYIYIFLELILKKEGEREREVEREMGRQPCCEKVGLKKGPWTSEEDKKLINFILTNGQCCWRAVPKLAGLLRCGKSCRLRWTNYLRPDLKRGLLSDFEEKLVIDLHAQLGNRSSLSLIQSSSLHPFINSLFLFYSATI